MVEIEILQLNAKFKSNITLSCGEGRGEVTKIKSSPFFLAFVKRFGGASLRGTRGEAL